MFRIATRGSDLALAQTEYIQACLAALGYSTEQRIIKTTGDVNLAPFALAGGDERKGLFTKEIEDALLAKEAEIAVHSYKDLPSISVPELMIAAIPQRLDARDYFLCKKTDQVSDHFPFVRPNACIGTSSVRRRSQLNHLFPSLSVMELRGNVPTRVRRLFEANGPEGILLSGAGVQRLIEQKRFVEQELLDQLVILPVDVQTLVPASAQGTLAVQCRVDDAVTREALAQLHDAALAEILAVERGVLAALEGGCHLPLGIQARRTPDYAEAAVYLGKEFAHSRYGHTVQFTRRHADAARLRDFLVSELKDPAGTIPLYVFGKEDRMHALSKSYQGIRPVAAIRTRAIADASALPNIGDGDLIACFSAEGMRHLFQWRPDWFSRKDLLWGVPGQKTSALLQEKGVRPAQIVVSKDGTGKGLALLLTSEHKHRLTNHNIIGISASVGSDQFYEVMAAAGHQARRVDMYATEEIPLPEGFVLGLPENAYLLFGSPSSFDAFAAAVEKCGPRGGEAWKGGWRICSIGKTTTEAIRSYAKRQDLHGLAEPYMTALEPDYDKMIEEILGL